MDSTTTHEPLSQAKQPLPSGFRPLRRIDSNVPRSTKQNVKPEKIEEEKLWPPPCPEQRKESGTARLSVTVRMSENYTVVPLNFECALVAVLTEHHTYTTPNLNSGL
eukprot:343416-Amorphochlora_amoeboformis.AAC.2